MDFFRYDLYSVYKTKTDLGTAEEDGLTTKEMAEAHKHRARRTMNSDTIRKSFLYELMNNGYVEEVSIMDKRRKIYRPIVEPELEPEKIQKLRESTQSRNILQPSVIILPRFCNSVPENWLVLQVLGFLKCRLDPRDVLTIFVEDLTIINSNGSKQTITQFVREFEYHYSLILYFRKAKYGNFHTHLFQMSQYTKG
jgi:hypothetical protein